MTEDEAKTKWCPHARTARDGEDFAANRDRDGVPIDRKHTCITSDCMAWREVWEDIPILKNGRAVAPGEAYFKRDVAKTNRHLLGGFCGLAGAPR